MKRKTSSRAAVVLVLFVAACAAAWAWNARRAAADVPDVDWPVSSRPAEAGLDAKISRLDALVGEIEKRGLDASYARSSLAVARDFIAYARDDDANGRPNRAAYVRGYLDGALDSAIAEAQALIDDPSRNRPIPRPPLRDIEIRDGAFFAGDAEVMFGGVGHFGKVRQDIPKFDDYGFNLIQIEIGPNSVVAGPGAADIRTDAITNDIIPTLDNAEKHNIMVNLLLSPHYFPQWAMDAYPELKQCGKGFIQYCVSDPRARAVLRRFLETLIPMVKDKPALQSYTLANEPQFDERGDATIQKFREYLKEKYGDIGHLNRAWRKKYKNFDNVRIDNDSLNLSIGARLDWTTFHNEICTEFFQWMKDTIRAIDPRTPVNIKFMDPMFENDETFWGIDREALEGVTDISGNDSTIRFPGHDGYAMYYQQNAAFFDFLKSVRPDTPVQNSEDHIIADDVAGFYPENYIRAALWSQYIHGMGASTIWVWERSDGPSLGNNILSRPNCAAAAARTTLDVRRLAPWITALANADSPVYIYYSQAARVMQFDFLEKWNPAYEFALYSGWPVKFVTDRMLAAGIDPEKVKTLIVPEYLYTTDALYAKLIDFAQRGGRVVEFGNCFRLDERGKPRGSAEWAEFESVANPQPGQGAVAKLPSFDRISAERDFNMMSDILSLTFGVQNPALLVTDPLGHPVLGVEYRSAVLKGKRIGYVFNALDHPVTVNLTSTADGGWTPAHDLIDGGGVPERLDLAPMQNLLFEF
jgi:hypothetical protein